MRARSMPAARARLRDDEVDPLACERSPAGVEEQRERRARRRGELGAPARAEVVAQSAACSAAAHRHEALLRSLAGDADRAPRRSRGPRGRARRPPRPARRCRRGARGAPGRAGRRASSVGDRVEQARRPPPRRAAWAGAPRRRAASTRARRVGRDDALVERGSPSQPRSAETSARDRARRRACRAQLVEVGLEVAARRRRRASRCARPSTRTRAREVAAVGLDRGAAAALLDREPLQVLAPGALRRRQRTCRRPRCSATAIVSSIARLVAQSRAQLVAGEPAAPRASLSSGPSGGAATSCRSRASKIVITWSVQPGEIMKRRRAVATCARRTPSLLASSRWRGGQRASSPGTSQGARRDLRARLGRTARGTGGSVRPRRGR